MIKITPFNPGEEHAVSELICSVFDEFVGYEYSEEGNDVFNDFVSPENILERYRNGNILLTCRGKDRIIGMIEIRDNNHICLFFVDKQYHNTGVGRALLQKVLTQIRGRSTYLEVNASPFSEPIYRKLGFTTVGEKTEKNGILFIPMIMKLS